MTGSNPKGLRTASRLAEIGPDGSISGYNDVRFSYDDRKRPIQTRMRYKDGFILTEDTEYGFAGEVLSSVFTYSSPQNIISKLSQDYTYDNRGRILSESATLYKDVGSNVIALTMKKPSVNFAKSTGYRVMLLFTAMLDELMRTKVSMNSSVRLRP